MLSHGSAADGDSVIRELETTDLPRVADLVRRLLPTMVVTERGLDHMRKSTRWWVVEGRYSIVGAARAGRFGRCWVGVAPEARGRGIGSALLEIVERTLHEAGHPQAVAWTDDEQGARFAGRHGYSVERRKPVSVLRLAGHEPPPLAVPPGVDLVPIGRIDDRLHELYELTMSAYRDDPADAGDAQQSFEEWLRDDIGVPDLDFQGSVVAVVDGQFAALALVTTDGAERAENELTGTHPDYRGRGLATLVKLSTVHWARRRGIHEIWTANDSENAPMLAINRKLGYRPAHERRKVVKGL